MKSYKLISRTIELYFPDSESASLFLEIDEDLFLFFYQHNIKFRGYWIDRPQYTDEEVEYGKYGIDKIFNFQTKGVLSNGTVWLGNEPMLILDQIIAYQKNNKSEFGLFLTEFCKKYYDIYAGELDYLDKEDIADIIIDLGQEIDKSNYNWTKLLDMFECLV